MRVVAIVGSVMFGALGALAGLGTAAATDLTQDAAHATAARRPLSPDDFYKMQIISEPQVSPDGQWVAYVVTTNDRDADESRSAIWMVSWDGSQQLPLTNAVHGISAPRWSGDGRYLAFISTPPGADKEQIMLLDRRGGEARALTNVSDDIQEYDWSPDGKRLVVSMDQGDVNTGGPAKSAVAGVAGGGTPPATGSAATAGGAGATTGAAPPKPIVIESLHFKQDKDGYLAVGHPRHLYLVDVESRKLEPLTTDPARNDDLPVWSPDSRRIAFVRTREKGPDPDGMAEIDVIDAQAGAMATQLVRAFEPGQQKLAWSPDGRLLAFVQGLEPKYSQYAQDELAIVPVAGGGVRVLAKGLDRPVTSYAFADAGSIAVTINDDGTAFPALVDLRSGVATRIVEGSFVVSEIAAAGGHMAALYADDKVPNEVYALEGGHLRKLSRHNDVFVAELQLGTVEDFRFKSRDGTPIHGLLVKPPGYVPGKQYPTVLYIHGGPNLQDEHSVGFDGYQFKRQLLAAGGFVVAGINYRGSTGRGAAFSRAIFADWGHKEVEDLSAGVDALVARGIADPARLGIGGWSYGGILTDYMIATSPRFKAAFSGAGTANPLALYGSDEYESQYNNELGVPWRNTALYLKLAYPLLHADRIHTPTLFMGGDKDFNVPINGGEQMYLALRTLGVPAKMVVYPGQFHTLTRPSFLMDRAERMNGWFGQYLQPGRAAAPH